MKADPDYLVGCKAIGKALGLRRCPTMWLIQLGTIHTILIGHTRCAKRSEIDRYLAAQINTDTWDNEGGALGSPKVEEAWTESLRVRRRRGRANFSSSANARDDRQSSRLTNARAIPALAEINQNYGDVR